VSSYEKLKVKLYKEVEKHFRPEFLNRVDDTIVFRGLSRENLTMIVEYEMKKVFKRLADHGIELELTGEAKEFLIEKGYNPDFGARPLRRAIEQFVEDPLSEQILKGEYRGKDRVIISVKEGQLFFEGVSSKTPKSETPSATVGETTT